MLNVTIAAKTKDAFGTFFDESYVRTMGDRHSFIRPNVGSLYRLGKLTGLVLYISPHEMIVLTIQVKGSRDIIAAYNFFEVAGGTKIIANMINVPSGAAGDAVVGAV
ncbi:MAG TPA: hypothetical protein VMC79_15355, partial [Rectinemataceae bacterium]|nr:hypothetical protein [Rectinemataceae bacterium]